jgi:hypothetical protein
MCVPKEPHFFSTDLRNRNIQDWGDYLDLFRTATEGYVAVGEASTWYLYSRQAVPNIELTCPGSKYIVMTRRSEDMALSLYLHNRRHLHERAPSFEVAWGLQLARELGLTQTPEATEPAFLKYRLACSLGEQLGRLLSVVPTSRVFHVSLDELKKDPGLVYRSVLRFLGIRDDTRSFFPIFNEAATVRSRAIQALLLRLGALKSSMGIRRNFGVTSLNEKPAVRRPLTPEMQIQLRESFRQDEDLRMILLEKLRSAPTPDE